MRMLLQWVLTALAIWIVSRLVPGISATHGATAALIAAVVIGFVNATLGLFLKIVTFPLTLLTFGLFWLVIGGAHDRAGVGDRAGISRDGLLGGVLGRHCAQPGEHGAEVGCVSGEGEVGRS